MLMQHPSQGGTENDKKCTYFPETPAQSKKHEKTFIRLSLIASLVLVSIGCQSHSVQTTSGRQYLNQYEELDLPTREAGSIDEEVRKSQASSQPSAFPLE